MVVEQKSRLCMGILSSKSERERWPKTVRTAVTHLMDSSEVVGLQPVSGSLDGVEPVTLSAFEDYQKLMADALKYAPFYNRQGMDSAAMDAVGCMRCFEQNREGAKVAREEVARVDEVIRRLEESKRRIAEDRKLVEDVQYFEGACTLAEVAELKELGAPFFDRVLELTSRAIMKLFDQRLATSKKLESHMGNIAAIRSSIIPFVSDHGHVLSRCCISGATSLAPRTSRRSAREDAASMCIATAFQQASFRRPPWWNMSKLRCARVLRHTRCRRNRCALLRIAPDTASCIARRILREVISIPA